MVEIKTVNDVAETTRAGSQNNLIINAVENYHRIKEMFEKGEHLCVIIDSLDELEKPAARKLMGAARNVPGAGSLTIIAAATIAVGGETTLIYVVPQDGGKIGDPAVDKAMSKTLRSNLLS